MLKKSLCFEIILLASKNCWITKGKSLVNVFPIVKNHLCLAERWFRQTEHTHFFDKYSEKLRGVKLVNWMLYTNNQKHYQKTSNVKTLSLSCVLTI